MLKKIKFPLRLIITVIVTFGFSISLQSIMAVWSPPLSAPGTCVSGNPGCDVPLNVSGTGQSKDGGLILNHTGSSANGLIVESGNVGIGTTNPGINKLYVNNVNTSDQDNIGIRSYTVNDATLTTTGRYLRAGYFDTLNRQVENGFNSFGYGIDGVARTDGSNTFNWLRGGNFTAYTTSIDTVNQDFLAGSLSTGYLNSAGNLTSAYGTYNQAYNNSSGNITTAIGAYNLALKNIGSIGNVTTGYGTYSRVRNSNNTNAGSIATAYGYYGLIDRDIASVDFGTAYGLRLNVSGGATRWGVYTEYEQKNYFSGAVGIGTSSPNANTKLQVTGEITSDSLGANGGNLRMIGGNYGIFFRNDGANTYMLLTASGNQYGTWNTLRPFIINNATGDLYTNSLFSGANGKVGVGTVSPSEKLSVNGNVKIDGSSGASTYVFVGYAWSQPAPRCWCDTGQGMECGGGVTFSTNAQVDANCYDWYADYQCDYCGSCYTNYYAQQFNFTPGAVGYLTLTTVGTGIVFKDSNNGACYLLKTANGILSTTAYPCL